MPKAKLEKLKPEVLKRILSCYSAVGFESKKIAKNLTHHFSPYWRNSTFSPVWLQSRILNPGTLKSVEAHFRRNRLNHFFSKNDPYIQFFKNDFFNMKANSKILAANGWEPSLPNQRISVWLNLKPLSIGPRFQIKVGNIRDPILFKDYIRVMRKNFGHAPRLEADLLKLHRKIGDHVVIVVIYNSRKEAISSGLVATNRKFSYLYCGSVLKKYRKKGIWHLLVAARQAASNSGPGHTWMTTTGNPKIAGQGDLSLEVLTFVKKLEVK